MNQSEPTIRTSVFENLPFWTIGAPAHSPRSRVASRTVLRHSSRAIPSRRLTRPPHERTLISWFANT